MAPGTAIISASGHENEEAATPAAACTCNYMKCVSLSPCVTMSQIPPDNHSATGDVARAQSFRISGNGP